MIKKNIPAAVSFLLPLIVYAFTLCPATYTEDTGEFITASYILGVTHPPGYPLYCLLGKLFTYIPVNTIAWRVNFMSAFWGAVAALFLFLLIRRITRRDDLAFLSSMLFSFSPVFWSQCVIAEVYSLNIFFLVVCLYVLDLWRDTRNDKHLYLFSFIYGLSLCNHHFMLLAGPVFVIFILWNDFKLIKKPRLLLGCMALFALALTPYFYLIAAAKMKPALNFGNPDTLVKALAHIRREVYSDVFLFGGGVFNFSDKLFFIKAFFVQLFEQFGPVFTALGAAGIYYFCKKDLKYFALIIGIFIFTAFPVIFMRQFPASYDRAAEMSVYYFPCYAAFACCVAFGALWLLSLSDKKLKGAAVRKILYALFIFLALVPVLLNYYKCDLSKNYYAYDFVKSTMDLMDKNAIAFTNSDVMTFNIVYFQNVEDYRKDIKIQDINDCVRGDYFGGRVKINAESEEKNNIVRREIFNKIIDENYALRPIYFTYSFDLGADSKYKLAPFGIIFKAVKKGEKLSEKFNPLTRIHLRNLDAPPVYRDYRVCELLSFYWMYLGFYYESVFDFKMSRVCFENVFNLNNSAAINNLGFFFLENGKADLAVKYFNKAIAVDPYPAEIYFNLARGCEAQGQNALAVKNYEIFIKKWRGDPRYAEYAKMMIKRLQN